MFDATRIAKLASAIDPKLRDDLDYAIRTAEAIERDRILKGVTEIRKRLEDGNNEFQLDRALAVALRIEAGIRGGNFV